MTGPMGGMGGWEMLRGLRREGELSGRRIGRATARRIMTFARPYGLDIGVFLVAVVLAAGITVATALYGLFSRLRVDGLAVAFDGRAVLTWAAALGVLGLVSAVASVRGVLAVEPAAALGGGLDR